MIGHEHGDFYKISRMRMTMRMRMIPHTHFEDEDEDEDEDDSHLPVSLDLNGGHVNFVVAIDAVNYNGHGPADDEDADDGQADESKIIID